ncbi:MAG: rhodanese-like domain-containing protein [Thermodesulfobacteriota bacterium]
MNPLDISSRVAIEEVRETRWVIMDMRFSDEYAEGHAPGAMLLPGWISRLNADDTKQSETVIPRLEKETCMTGVKT